MRIRDLIPDRDALITPDFYRRKNLLVQVIEDDDARAPRGQRRARRSSAMRARRRRIERRANDRRASRQPVRAATGRGDRDAADTSRSAATPTVAADRIERRSTAPRIDEPQPSERARDDDRAAVARARRTPAALFDELNWDYATIERLNPDLSTQVIPFNLGKAVLQGDDGEQHRAEARRRRHGVQPEGRPRAGGAADAAGLARRRGRRARHLPAAGRRDAAAADRPRRRLHAAGLRLRARVHAARRRARASARTWPRRSAGCEALSAVQAARDAANRRDDPAGAQTSSAVSSARDAGAAGAPVAASQPNGRIALELTPEIALDRRLPDVPLENGDRISVPPRPGFVTVAGAVVNSNAFVWKAGPHRRRLPAPGRPRRGRRHRQHVHPARRRHRQQRGRQARLLRPRRPRVGRCCSRATR